MQILIEESYTPAVIAVKPHGHIAEYIEHGEVVKSFPANSNLEAQAGAIRFAIQEMVRNHFSPDTSEHSEEFYERFMEIMKMIKPATPEGWKERMI